MSGDLLPYVIRCELPGLDGDFSRTSRQPVVNKPMLKVEVNVANAHQVECLLRGIGFQLRSGRHEQHNAETKFGRKEKPTKPIASPHALQPEKNQINAKYSQQNWTGDPGKAFQ